LLAFHLLIAGCAVIEKPTICGTGFGVAVVEKDVICNSLDMADFSKSKFDLKDPHVLRLLLLTRRILSSDLSEGTISSDLRNIAGNLVVEELRKKRMQAVYEILPDFADTLSINTYRVSFFLDSSDRVELLIDSASGVYQWNFLVE